MNNNRFETAPSRGRDESRMAGDVRRTDAAHLQWPRMEAGVALDMIISGCPRMFGAVQGVVVAHARTVRGIETWLNHYLGHGDIAAVTTGATTGLLESPLVPGDGNVQARGPWQSTPEGTSRCG
jgi:hypothetical protein